MNWISHSQAMETALQELGYDSANSQDTADQIRREKSQQWASGVPRDNTAPLPDLEPDQEPRRQAVADLRADAREGETHPVPTPTKIIRVQRNVDTGLIESAIVEELP
jgi:hypothetical protein